MAIASLSLSSLQPSPPPFPSSSLAVPLRLPPSLSFSRFLLLPPPRHSAFVALSQPLLLPRALSREQSDAFLDDDADRFGDAQESSDRSGGYQTHPAGGRRPSQRTAKFEYERMKDMFAMPEPERDEPMSGTRVMDARRSRTALLSEGQASRLQNKFSVFERVTHPKIVRLSPQDDIPSSLEASSAESAASPRNYPKSDGRKASYNGNNYPKSDSRKASYNGNAMLSAMSSGKYPPNAEQGEKSDASSPNFSSKLQAILDNFKAKGHHTVAARSKASPVAERSKTSSSWGAQIGKDSRTEARQAHPTDSRKWVRKDMQTPEETDLSVNKFSDSVSDEDERENIETAAQSDGEAGTSSATDTFDLFAKPPAIPAETRRRVHLNPKSRIPFDKSQNANVAPRRLSRSIGSRSSPSRPSIPAKFSKYTRTTESQGNGRPISRNNESESLFDWNEYDDQRQSSDGSPTATLSSKSTSLNQTSPESLESFSFDDLTDSETETDIEHGSSMSTAPAGLHSASSTPKQKPHDEEASGLVMSSAATKQRDRSSLPASRLKSNHSSSKMPDSIGERVDLHNSSDSAGVAESQERGETQPVRNHALCDLPFEIQYSYSETPKIPIIRYREPPHSPFGPSTMGRPWTGRAPLKPSKKKLREFDSFNPPPKGKKGIKFVQDPGPYPEGQGPNPAKTREEILGEPLTRREIVELVEKCKKEKRQLNLGRDGLTHNMLDLVHTHWKRRRVCRIKCKGVPTVDMDNVCFHIEDKTGGKIIYRTGGVLYVFRGRNYNYRDRPKIPLMLWKPITPVYPKLIQKAPEGLTFEEARQLRALGQKVTPLCRLGKNGVYLNLVKDVRSAFRVDDLVRIDCRGLNPSDYKKIGAKLKDLVPCVLLSFDKEQILMWKGRGLNASFVADPLSGDAPATPIDNPSLEAPQQSISTDYLTEDEEGLSAELDGDEGEYDDAFSDIELEEEEGEEAYMELSEVEGDDGEHDDASSDVEFEEEGEEASMGLSEMLEGDHGESDDASDVELEEDEGGVDSGPIRVDGLWEQAVESGMAVQLDESGLDIDLIFEKADELARTAPRGPTYSRKLLNKLRLNNGENKPKELIIDFGRKKNMMNMMRPKKQPKKLQDVPRVEVPPMGGLPVDELARLLAPKRR